MATENQINQAEIAFDTLCETLNEMGWTYGKEDRFTIETGAAGDDIPMILKITIDPDRQLISLLSPFEFTVPEEKRIEVAAAICAINYMLVDGNFDYNVGNGRIIFRITSSIINSLVSKEVFKYLILVSCKTIDDYNDKLLLLSKGEITLESFLN